MSRSLDYLDAVEATGTVLPRLERILRFDGGLTRSALLDTVHAHDGGVQALDAVDLLVRLLTRVALSPETYNVRGVHDTEDVARHVGELGLILREGGSAWEVADFGSDRWGLRHRVGETVQQRADMVLDATSSAAQHMREAWRHLYGRHPDPTRALDEVVKALEAAAKPVVSPTDAKATLGKMIGALRDKPAKWTTPVGTVDQLREQLSSIWDIQPRHGSDEPNAIRTVDSQAAEAAVQLAIGIVHGFERGLIKRSRA